MVIQRLMLPQTGKIHSFTLGLIETGCRLVPWCTCEWRFGLTKSRRCWLGQFPINTKEEPSLKTKHQQSRLSARYKPTKVLIEGRLQVVLVNCHPDVLHLPINLSRKTRDKQIERKINSSTKSHPHTLTTFANPTSPATSNIDALI